MRDAVADNRCAAGKRANLFVRQSHVERALGGTSRARENLQGQGGWRQLPRASVRQVSQERMVDLSLDVTADFRDASLPLLPTDTEVTTAMEGREG